MNSPTKLSTPIVSLSLNPAIDLTYEVNTLKHEHKSRATRSYFDPGGTGINVGRALQKLKSNSYTCYITAGIMGQFLDVLLNQELSNLVSIKVAGETRVNTTVLQQNPSAQYEINAVGPLISNNQLNQIVDKFLALCQQGIGVLTGSLPPGLEPDTYQKINLKLQQQGAKAIIDASAQPLNQAISSNPFLIKPNLHELELLTNKSLTTIEDIAKEARLINKQGTHYICVSLAEKGAILVSSNNSYYCQPPNITVHSTVGAGDSMVAGLAYAFANKMTDKEALTLAVACGASTAQQGGTQLFELSEVEILSKQITLKTLDI